MAAKDVLFVPDSLFSNYLEPFKNMKQPIETAPKDGTPILGIYEDGEVQIQWAERRTCMMAGIAGGHGYFGPGWEDCENKLIVDEPKHWRGNENTERKIGKSRD